MSLENLYDIYLQSSGICTDSRQAAPGTLFFALRGDNFNGNLYAGSALSAGCSYAIVDDPEEASGNKSFIAVENVLHTLQSLGNLHRKKLGIPVLAITGTNGKTTSKELIHDVLSRKFRVLATRGNLNNHIGVPLTLLRLKDEEIAIVEMGANHPGEIAALCEIADPDYGLITNIGFAHLEGFGSPEGILKTKTELYRYLDKKNGTIFINGMNDILTTAAPPSVKKIEYAGGSKPVCKGHAGDPSVFLNMDISFADNGTYHATTHLTGTYNVENILAAACIGKYFDVEENNIVSAIEAYTPSNNRSQVTETASNRIVMDAYNANPTSMKGAIRNFLEISSPKKLLILGDMLELGDYANTEHRRIVEMLQNHPGPEVFLVGPEFAQVAKGIGYHLFNTAEDLIEHLRKNAVYDHLILLKGSRGMRLERVISML